MSTSRFKPEEVVSLLKEMAKGASAREICLRDGVSETTSDTWRSKYEGLEARGIRRLRQLVQENSTLRNTLEISQLHLSALKAELSRLEAQREDQPPDPDKP